MLFVVLGLVFSISSQETGLGKRLQNDRFFVEWDVKPQLSHLVSQWQFDTMSWVVVECQRDPLDEQFDELLKDMSEELREKIDMELATDGDAAACDDSDMDVLLVEYVSDDENPAPADKVNMDDEDDDECDHVLKVSDIMSLWSIPLSLLLSSKRLRIMCTSTLPYTPFNGLFSWTTWVSRY